MTEENKYEFKMDKYKYICGGIFLIFFCWLSLFVGTTLLQGSTSTIPSNETAINCVYQIGKMLLGMPIVICTTALTMLMLSPWILALVFLGD